jgi:hypothetical protein
MERGERLDRRVVEPAARSDHMPTDGRQAQREIESPFSPRWRQPPSAGSPCAPSSERCKELCRRYESVAVYSSCGSIWGDVSAATRLYGQALAGRLASGPQIATLPEGWPFDEVAALWLVDVRPTVDPATYELYESTYVGTHFAA